MKSELNPENIYLQFNNGELDKKLALRLLTTLFKKNNIAFSYENLSLNLEIIKKIDQNFAQSFVVDELNEIINFEPDIINYLGDVKWLPKCIDPLISLLLNCKTLLYMKQKFGNKFTYDAATDENFLIKITIRGINVKKISDINGLKYLTGVVELYLINNNIEEIDLLENFTDLWILKLENNHIKEIQSIKNLTHLTELSFKGNEISDISGLDNLESLSVLDLSKNKISEIKGLTDLPSLDALNLSHNKIAEIKGLETLNLSKLFLSHNQITEIKGIETLYLLKHLELQNNNIKVMEGLSNLKQLNYLDLRNNNISKIRRFGKNINHILLEGNQISKDDLSDFILSRKYN
ncbi:MAG: leucine-rich repeat domain-containing protein [Promethearchaeota archaeon]